MSLALITDSVWPDEKALKRCARCRQRKPVTSFGISATRKAGLHPYCKDCSCAYAKEWRKRNPEKRKAQAARHYQRHRTRLREERHKWYREHSAEHNRTVNASRLLRRYGITTDHYAALVAIQDGKCAICQTIPNGRPLEIDHDHGTGRIRGLLCFRCNLALGFLGDNPHLLPNVAAYLGATL